MLWETLENDLVVEEELQFHSWQDLRLATWAWQDLRLATWACLVVFKNDKWRNITQPWRRHKRTNRGTSKKKNSDNIYQDSLVIQLLKIYYYWELKSRCYYRCTVSPICNSQEVYKPLSEYEAADSDVKLILQYALHHRYMLHFSPIFLQCSSIK